MHQYMYFFRRVDARWYPPSYKLIHNPYQPKDITSITPRYIGLIGTNLANELGHHLVLILNNPYHSINYISMAFSKAFKP